MAWYPLPRSEGAMSAGDEFFENQPAGWSLWSFSNASGDRNACSEKHGDGDAQCGIITAPSEEEEEESAEGPAPLEDPWFFAQPTTEDIFLSQFSFSDEEMGRMDAPLEVEALLSYESMLTGVLTGSEEGDAKLDRNGSSSLEQSNLEMLSAEPPDEDGKAGLNTTKKRSRPVESTPSFEALVLEELEDVVFQLTKRTRICYRDAFYRLAESSKPNCSTANGDAEVGTTTTSRQQSFQRPDGIASRFSAPGCPERETNPIDRTVVVLTMKPPHQRHGNCCADDSGGRGAVHNQLDHKGVGG